MRSPVGATCQLTQRNWHSPPNVFSCPREPSLNFSLPRCEECLVEQIIGVVRAERQQGSAGKQVYLFALLPLCLCPLPIARRLPNNHNNTHTRHVRENDGDATAAHVPVNVSERTFDDTMRHVVPNSDEKPSPPSAAFEAYREVCRGGRAFPINMMLYI